MEKTLKQKVAILKQKYIFYREKRKAFIIGQRAAQGKNIYITFGSEKTCPKNAEDSFRRYAMAMKHYNQDICDKKSFLLGFNKTIYRHNMTILNCIISPSK